MTGSERSTTAGPFPPHASVSSVSRLPSRGWDRRRGTGHRRGPDHQELSRAAQAGPVSPGFPIDAVGVTWDEEPRHADEHDEAFGDVRFRHDGSWGPWHAFGEDGAQVESSFGTTLVAGEDADAYQVRGVPAHAEVVALNTTDGPAREVRARPAGAADALTDCWSRHDWGADGSLAPANERVFTGLQILTVHHTGESAHASGDPAAWVRSIYEYHLSRGWDDIGYQYLVGPGGELFEGRRSEAQSEACQSDHDGDGILGDGSDVAHDGLDQVVTGAHTGGDNTGTNSKTVHTVAMHEDFTSTACPGGKLENDLPAIRDDVAAILTATAPSDPDGGDGDQQQTSDSVTK
ncbi:MAG: hypothetical protein KY457_03645 [Actinobacteria bacterium]|nr:hypothetical protein [Actinomycetota bacterium]